MILKRYIKKNIWIIMVLLCLITISLSGCAKDNSGKQKSDMEEVEGRDNNTKIGGDRSDDSADKNIKGENDGEDSEKDNKKVAFHFVDVFGEGYDTFINPEIPKVVYDNSKYKRDGQNMTYDDDKYKSRPGVDVSYHQGDIDWKQVRDAGYDFAILRIAYRGYSQTGKLVQDTKFEEYYKGAKDAGLDVGVYFFAQAVNEQEALEEADFVLNILAKREIDLPVIYDPESILDDVARTDNVTCEQFTKNSVVFCDRIREAGYRPMIYANMLWEAFNLDLSKIKDVPVWYADYEPLPQTPYDYSFWQYDNEGKVPGISGNCDLDIELIKK